MISLKHKQLKIHYEDKIFETKIDVLIYNLYTKNERLQLVVHSSQNL